MSADIRNMISLKAGIKSDPARCRALPDRVFSGHGACAVLAGMYLRDPPLHGFIAERIPPDESLAGNHIHVTDGVVAFVHHGYALGTRLLLPHTNGWARQ
jgi:hypothetical protein